jgi:hypothetical protein
MPNTAELRRMRRTERWLGILVPMVFRRVVSGKPPQPSWLPRRSVTVVSADVDFDQGIGAVWLVWRPTSAAAQTHIALIERCAGQWRYTGAGSMSGGDVAAERSAAGQPGQVGMIECGGSTGGVDYAWRLQHPQSSITAAPWVGASELRVAAEVDHLLVGGRRIDVPGHGSLIVTWKSRSTGAGGIRPVIVAIGRDGSELSRLGPYDGMDSYTWAEVSVQQGLSARPRRPRLPGLAERAGEKVAGGSEREGVGLLVVGDAGDRTRLGIGVGEAVLGTAVHVQLPVRAGGVHLLGERGDVGERDVRVHGAVANEQPRPHLAGLGAGAGGQAAVDADRGCDRCPGPGELERGQAAEAEPDDRHPLVDGLDPGKQIQAGSCPADQAVRVIAHPGEERDDLLPRPASDVAAEHVAREHDVAELRVAAGLLPGVIIESGAAVHEHDTRPAPAWLGGVDEELADKLGIAVRVRLRFGVNHKPNSN